MNWPSRRGEECTEGRTYDSARLLRTGGFPAMTEDTLFAPGADAGNVGLGFACLLVAVLFVLPFGGIALAMLLVRVQARTAIEAALASGHPDRDGLERLRRLAQGPLRAQSARLGRVNADRARKGRGTSRRKKRR
ncbi:hypothetical protein V2W30_33345 [Streptomyces sp. Q6]|uniref:Uncharacterized protein n=1 Tax=Streptomyces citrinus TaxID=3118173 RepID=A0ACD5AKF6_9ACTN